MTTVNVNVKVWSNFGRHMLERSIEVDLFSNDAGRVFVDDSGGFAAVKVEITGLGDLARLTDMASIVVWPSHTEPELRGKVIPKGTKAEVEGRIKLDNRPLLRELYDAAIAVSRRIEEERQALWTAERDEAEARVTAGFPEGSVLVRFLRSEADGWVEIWSDPDGRSLRSPKVRSRVGSLGCMTPEDHAAAVAEHDAEAAKEEASRKAAAARSEALLTAAVPPDAVESYRAYSGDQEAAWDDGDETAAVLIERYADAIEAQGLGRPGAAVVRRILRGDEMPIAEG